MTKKIYVIFHDHFDKDTDKWGEYNADYVRDFVEVVGTIKQAHDTLGKIMLRDYYEAVLRADYEIWEEDTYEWYEAADDILRFKVRKDEENFIEMENDGDLDQYYYGEFEVTFDEEAG